MDRWRLQSGQNLREEKKGMTWEMIKAKIQVTSRMPNQLPHPTTVWLFMCTELRNARKKTKRAVTEAYRHPRKMRVGIMKEKETFL